MINLRLNSDTSETKVLILTIMLSFHGCQKNRFIFMLASMTERIVITLKYVEIDWFLFIITLEICLLKTR